MCTIVIAHRPGHEWPMVIAANRDERAERAWEPPAAYWPGSPGVIAGRDRTGGGTWMGVNPHGVMAAVLNRPGSLGPAPGKRSRGDLPLIALGHATAPEAADALARLDAGLWRPFNMVIAGRDGAIFVRGTGEGRPSAVPLDPGIHMVTAHDPDDPDSPRVARHLPRFRAAEPAFPGAWESWRAILSDPSGPPGTELCVPIRDGFGTVCASLLAISAYAGRPPDWLFAPGPPDRTAFAPVASVPGF